MGHSRYSVMFGFVIVPSYVVSVEKLGKGCMLPFLNLLNKLVYHFCGLREFVCVCYLDVAHSVCRY